MFKCEQCKKITMPGEPKTMIVVKVADKKYVNGKANFKEEDVEITDNISYGTEIRQEIAICPSCVEGRKGVAHLAEVIDSVSV